MCQRLPDPFEPYALPTARAAETPAMPQTIRARAAQPGIAFG